MGVEELDLQSGLRICWPLLDGQNPQGPPDDGVTGAECAARGDGSACWRTAPWIWPRLSCWLRFCCCRQERRRCFAMRFFLASLVAEASTPSMRWWPPPPPPPMAYCPANPEANACGTTRGIG
jgi:hypothetical protein